MTAVYTKEDYARAYTELIEVLKHISTSSLNKIPKENLEMYNAQKDKNYKYKYNEDLEFEEQNMSQLTRILIANLYIEYWASEEEKSAIKEKDKEELLQIEMQKREQYNPDNLFANRKVVKKEEVATSLTAIKEKNIFEKIIDKIKSIFRLT